ncbi:hypothetical protein Lser_V15G31319 [Lactuca serriola]
MDMAHRLGQTKDVIVYMLLVISSAGKGINRSFQQHGLRRGSKRGWS